MPAGRWGRPGGGPPASTAIEPTLNIRVVGPEPGGAMADSKEEKLVIVVTHGGEDAERASIPFVMANAALAMEAKVTIVLQASGVTVGTRGFYEHIFAPGFDPVKKLVDTFLELHGTIIVCIPCIEHRKIPVEKLVPGVQPAKAGRVVQEMLEATAVVSY